MGRGKSPRTLKALGQMGLRDSNQGLDQGAANWNDHCATLGTRDQLSGEMLVLIFEYLHLVQFCNSMNMDLAPKPGQKQNKNKNFKFESFLNYSVDQTLGNLHIRCEGLGSILINTHKYSPNNTFNISMARKVQTPRVVVQNAELFCHLA